MNHHLLCLFVPQGGALVVYQIVVFILTKHKEAITVRKFDVLKWFFFFFNRYDWYQTESQVIITLMIKNVQKNNVNVEFSEKEVITVFEPFFILRLNTFICKYTILQNNL